jgi:DNA polymerase-3 subunit alpha/error-prone DNA polymerase
MAKEIPKLRHKTKVRVAGLLSVHQRPPTAKGVGFLTLEDETGYFNVVIFADIYQKYRTVLYEATFLEVRGTLENQNNVQNIIAHTLLPLDPIQLSANTAAHNSHLIDSAKHDKKVEAY